MRPISRLIMITLLTFGASTAAQAENPSSPSVLDPAILSVVSDLELDGAFEQAMATSADSAFLVVAGPSSMDCSPSSAISETEVCVVLNDSPFQVVPAALAQR